MHRSLATHQHHLEKVDGECQEWVHNECIIGKHVHKIHLSNAVQTAALVFQCRLDRCENILFGALLLLLAFLLCGFLRHRCLPRLPLGRSIFELIQQIPIDRCVAIQTEMRSVNRESNHIPIQKLGELHRSRELLGAVVCLQTLLRLRWYVRALEYVRLQGFYRRHQTGSVSREHKRVFGVDAGSSWGLVVGRPDDAATIVVLIMFAMNTTDSNFDERRDISKSLQIRVHLSRRGVVRRSSRARKESEELDRAHQRAVGDGQTMEIIRIRLFQLHSGWRKHGREKGSRANHMRLWCDLLCGRMSRRRLCSRLLRDPDVLLFLLLQELLLL